jgi:lipopolysaccharide transport system permease protein
MFNNHFLELLFALTQKEIKARYKHAILGFLWIFINPLVQMLVMGFVFSLIFKFGIKDYYLFLFFGLLPWNFFSLALTKATPRIVYDRSLIQKSKFPQEVIPLSIVLSHFFHFLVSWLMLIIFLLITQQWQFFSLSAISNQLLAIFLLVIFTSGLSLVTSALTVFYRDINFVVQMGIMLWFYVTPIIYPFSAVPQKFQTIFYLNPLLTVFSFLQKPLISLSIPFETTLTHILVILLTLFLGWRFFKSKAQYFSDWL